MRNLLPKKAKLDLLAGKIVRARGFCEAGDKCLVTATSGLIDKQLTWAHIISRRYLLTRWEIKNAFCLHMICHRYFTDHPTEWEIFVIEKIGEENYLALWQRAQSFEKVDYEATFLRLKETIRLMKI